MSGIRRDVPPTFGSRSGVRPRSPAEALEPGRAPSRPRGTRERPQSRIVSGFVRFVSGVMTVALVVMLALGGLTSLLLRHLYERPGPLKVAQTVVIPKGVGSNDIAERLAKDGVIESHWAFMISYLTQSRLGAEEVVLKSGEYLFKPGASIRDVIETLDEGKSVLYKVTVPEGLTSQQIVERLKQEENLSDGDTVTAPPDGALLPETYSIEKGMAIQELLERMEAKSQLVLEAAWEKRAPDTPLRNAQEALVLASIIEKETGRSDERERIAGVFINRLRKGMALQSDPTILYGLYGGAVQWGKPILQSEKDAKNAHNTYQIKGLPPTPICNPGRAAIEAALHPAATNDLFFVADGSGGHIFTATLKDHNAAVQNWRKLEKDMRARQAAKGDGTADAEAKPAEAAEGAAGDDGKAATGDEKVAKSDGAAIPNPPAEAPAAAPVPVITNLEPDGAASAAAPAATAGAQASTIPLPVRKPKR